jgi:hypothetical protein
MARLSALGIKRKAPPASSLSAGFSVEAVMEARRNCRREKSVEYNRRRRGRKKEVVSRQESGSPLHFEEAKPKAVTQKGESRPENEAALLPQRLSEASPACSIWKLWSCEKGHW